MALTGQLKSVDVDTDEEDEVATRSEARDAVQVQIDGIVKGLRDAWEAAGKPSMDVLTSKAGFKAAAKHNIVVVKEDASEAKRMIRRAATLHKVLPVFARDRTLEDGTKRIKFTVGPPKTKANANSTPPPAAAPDASTASAAAGGGQPEAARRGGFGRR